MGNGRTPKEKNVPRKVLPSGNGSVEIGDGGGAAEESPGSKDLIINLIKLNASTCSQARVADSVHLLQEGDTYVVYLGVAVLGVVPSNYNNALRASTEHWGLITKLQLIPGPAATIRVSVAY